MSNKPVAWAYIKDGEFWDAIHPDEHAQEEGSYTIPLYTQDQLEEARKLGMQQERAMWNLSASTQEIMDTHPVKEHFEDEPQAEELHEIMQSNAELTPCEELRVFQEQQNGVFSDHNACCYRHECRIVWNDWEKIKSNPVEKQDESFDRTASHMAGEYVAYQKELTDEFNNLKKENKFFKEILSEMDKQVYNIEFLKQPMQILEDGQIMPVFKELTDEEIFSIAIDCTYGGDLHADKFARAILRKAQEK